MSSHRQEYMKAWRESNKQRIMEYNKNYNLELDEETSRIRKIERASKRRENPLKWIYYSARARAEKNGVEFDLELEDLVMPSYCMVLGIPIQIGKGKMTDNSPSLDRINNSLGYTRDNVCIISWRANRIKSDSSIDELEKIISYMKANRKYDKGY